MQYLVHAKDTKNSFNDMVIECHDKKEMMKYAKECNKQGYEVKTEIRED